MSVHPVPSCSAVVLQHTHPYGLVGVGTHKGCSGQRNDIQSFSFEILKKTSLNIKTVVCRQLN